MAVLVARGTYVLILRLEVRREIQVGRLGRFTFPAGHYLYVGSALGPGGLPARLARHRKQDKPPRWHIDYLRRESQLVETWYVESARRLECAWAQVLLAWPGAEVLAPGFGASDCRCRSHLVRFARLPESRHLRQALSEQAGDALVICEPEEAGLETLLAALTQGQDRGLQEGAARALGRLGGQGVPALAALLRSGDSEARWGALWALRMVGTKEAIEVLLTALHDQDRWIRAGAVAALGEMRAATAAVSLADLLSDRDSFVADRAAEALARLGESAVNALVDALRSGPYSARLRAAKALAAIGSSQAVEPLCAAYLYDPNYLVQHYAQEALEKLGILEMVFLGQ